MIVVDTSALIAILDDEPEAAVYAAAIAEADPPLISAATLVEAGLVMLNRHGSQATWKVQALVQEAGFQIEPVTARQAQLALERMPCMERARDGARD